MVVKSLKALIPLSADSPFYYFNRKSNSHCRYKKRVRVAAGLNALTGRSGGGRKRGRKMIFPCSILQKKNPFTFHLSQSCILANHLTTLKFHVIYYKSLCWVLEQKILSLCAYRHSAELREAAANNQSINSSITFS